MLESAERWQYLEQHVKHVSLNQLKMYMGTSKSAIAINNAREGNVGLKVILDNTI
jgi:hypothetical protein